MVQNVKLLFEETKKPQKKNHMAEILELSDQEFKITLMKKVIHKVSRELETRRESQQMLRIRNTLTELKNTFDELTKDSKWPRKESVSLKICQQKLPNWKAKRKRN
jgi:hypothetical protein